MSGDGGALRIAIRRLAHGEGLPLPACASEGAAGLDLVAALPEDAPLTLQPGARTLVPTGLEMAIPPGFEGQVRPRSGLALRHGVTVLNAPGTIDADYRGEVQVLLVNLGDAPVAFRRGDRIAQLVICAVKKATLFLGDALDETTRGRGGFGSTGLASREINRGDGS
jgi:dUTP pyrophosphatase